MIIVVNVENVGRWMRPVGRRQNPEKIDTVVRRPKGVRFRRGYCANDEGKHEDCQWLAEEERKRRQKSDENPNGRRLCIERKHGKSDDARQAPGKVHPVASERREPREMLTHKTAQHHEEGD